MSTKNHVVNSVAEQSAYDFGASCSLTFSSDQASVLAPKYAWTHQYNLKGEALNNRARLLCAFLAGYNRFPR